MCLCTQGTTSLITYPVHRHWKSFAKTKIELGLIIRDFQTVSEMINEELAEKVELYSTKNAKQTEQVSPNIGQETSTKQKNQVTGL